MQKSTFLSFARSNSSVLLLILDSYMSLSTRLVSLKVCMWDFPFLIPFTILFNKKHEPFDFKTS